MKYSTCVSSNSQYEIVLYKTPQKEKMEIKRQQKKEKCEQRYILIDDFCDTVEKERDRTVGMKCFGG